MLAAREIDSGAFALGKGALHLDRPITVRLAWRVRLGGVELDGEVHAPGFADHRPARGRLSLAARRAMVYRFDFVSNTGAQHRFEGERMLSWRGLPLPVTVLRGRITRDGEEVGRALLRFDLRSDLWRFLRSITVKEGS
jgi:hypothetical protein